MRNFKEVRTITLITIFFLTTFLLLWGNVFSQTVATVEGVVTDEEGATLPGGNITVRNIETGYSYSTITRTDGLYIISGIEAGKYEIEVSLQGFAKQIRKGLTFNVGARLKIDFILTPAALEEEVTVVAEAPMVEVSKSEISNVVDREKIDDIPITLSDRSFEGWSYLTITTAGVADDGRDQVGSAQGAGYGELMVDGVSYERIATGRARAGVPADSIQEFRVITNQFQAEYGNASDLLRSAITRSGTNEFKGRLSAFYRNEAFNSVNYFVNHTEYNGSELPEDQWDKPEFRYIRFGGFIGGPIKKNKTHFFLCYDGLRLRTYSIITSPLVPPENRSVPRDDKPDRLMIKFNHQFNEKNNFTIRYNLDRPVTINRGVGGYNTIERALDYYRSVHDFYANWTFFSSDRSMNELRLQYSRQEDDIRVKSPGAYGIERPSGRFGKAGNLPQGSIFHRYQITDNFSLFLDRHSLKFGFDFSYAPWHFFMDRHIPGTFFFNTDAPFDANDPATYPFRFMYSEGNNTVDFPYTEFGIFAQDSWKVSNQLTLNIGLRYNIYDFEFMFFDKWNIKNLNPRFGFSYDPFGDGKTAIRGGIGTNSSNTPGNPLISLGFTGRLHTYTIVFPNYPDPFAPNPFFDPVIGSVSEAKYDAMKDQIAPYTLQTSLGIQREVLTDLSVGADLVWTKGYHLPRFAQNNPVIPGTSFIRVDPTMGDWFIMEDTGKSDYKGLYLTIKKRFSGGWGFDVAYTLSKSMTDTQSPTVKPDNYEDPENKRMYGPSNFDSRHMLSITSVVELPLGIRLSGLFYYRSATPWNAIYRTDVNKDGLVRDYVDEYRNSRRGFDFYFINLRLSKFINISRVRVQLLAEGYNITNRVNFRGVYSRYGSPRFGIPTGAGDPRQLQLGIRLDF